MNLMQINRKRRQTSDALADGVGDRTSCSEKGTPLCRAPRVALRLRWATVDKLLRR
jgi:hypothetical protein